MELNITFAGKSVGSIKIANFNAGLDKNLRAGLKKAGVYLEGELKKSLKGSNPTTFFFKSPHAELRSRTGRLRASITSRQVGYTVEVGVGGPAAKYGAANEYGAMIPVTEKMRGFLHYKGIHLKRSTMELTIPARPWFFPVWKEHHLDAIAKVNNEIMKPVRG